MRPRLTQRLGAVGVCRAVLATKSVIVKSKKSGRIINIAYTLRATIFVTMTNIYFMSCINGMSLANPPAPPRTIAVI